MLSTALENAVIYQIELDSCSLPIHYEQYVVTFHNLVVPAFNQISSLVYLKKMHAVMSNWLVYEEYESFFSFCL